MEQDNIHLSNWDMRVLTISAMAHKCYISGSSPNVGENCLTKDSPPIEGIHGTKWLEVGQIGPAHHNLIHSLFEHGRASLLCANREYAHKISRAAHVKNDSLEMDVSWLLTE